jgi:membrane protein YqaA with SNARE-associated domain
MTDDASLWALFASSFLAATLLPGGSEMVLFAVLRVNAWAAGAFMAIGKLARYFVIAAAAI